MQAVVSGLATPAQSNAWSMRPKCRPHTGDCCWKFAFTSWFVATNYKPYTRRVQTIKRNFQNCRHTLNSWFRGVTKFPALKDLLMLGCAWRPKEQHSSTPPLHLLLLCNLHQPGCCSKTLIKLAYYGYLVSNGNSVSSYLLKKGPNSHPACIKAVPVSITHTTVISHYCP